MQNILESIGLGKAEDFMEAQYFQEAQELPSEGGKAPEISVVIPVFNEEKVLPQLLERLTRVLERLGRSWESIFVDDGSKDRSAEILKEVQRGNPNITLIRFNRNYGQHAAVFAGFEASKGEKVITLDADLQNPPEEIPKVLEKLDQGYDLVGTIRSGRQDSFLRRIFSRWTNAIGRKITGVAIQDIGCMLRGYRREIVKEICRSKEISTFIPALAACYAGRIAEIEVAHGERASGESKYSPLRLVSLYFDLITSFSLYPLRVLTASGALAAFLGFCLGILLIAGRILFGSEWAASGVFTLFSILFIFIGAQFLALGFIGEYIGRIYGEVRRRPRFIIREILTSRGEGRERCAVSLAQEGEKGSGE